ncbi:MAG: TlpA family protein disulfide reductase, partial [Dysgonamonadaceae bacterium]|nr:TlpA family protein disulfide reductase [Dysgonamonadaceae bacterium]
KMLERTKEPEIHLALSQAIINVLSKYSRREYLLPEIFSDIKYPILGQAAPAIINGTDTIQPKNALIVFYDSDCGNCQNELHKIIGRYNLLKDNRIRVISIAADVNRGLFEETAQKLVWQDNLCDFRGFDGENFINYGVVGAPTLVLIDKDGIVRGRYARIEELLGKDSF